MSNKDQNKDTEQKNGNGRSPQVGALLRASRLRVGEDLREVSDILCIRYLYLEAIEECRYGDLPGNTYAVGFIRSYAEHLGLDGDEVVRRYRVEQSGQKNATDLAFPTPVPDSGVPKGAIVFIGVLIALLVYGGWYVTTTDESILSDLISPVPDHLKHLVTGDDAPAGTAASDAQTADTPASEVEKVVRETTAAAEQMVSDAGAEAQRTAEAAAEAAATVAENVSETAEAAAGDAQATSETVVEKIEGTLPDAAATASGDATQTAPEATSGVTPEITTVTPSAAPTEVTAPTGPVAAEPASVPAESETTESATAPVREKVAETAAPVSSETAIATGQATVPTETESTAATGAAMDAAQSDTQMTDTQMTETPVPAPQSVQPEVTAEDLNALVLRQATGVSDQGSTPPAPPETASLSSGDPAGMSGIVIRATSSSWVEIRNPANGDIIFTGLMNEGNTFNVPDTEGLTLDTGNAGALDITVDGASVPKIGGIGAVRKNVSLDVDRLKAGTATDQ